MACVCQKGKWREGMGVVFYKKHARVVKFKFCGKKSLLTQYLNYHCQSRYFLSKIKYYWNNTKKTKRAHKKVAKDCSTSKLGQYFDHEHLVII